MIRENKCQHEERCCQLEDRQTRSHRYTEDKCFPFTYLTEDIQGQQVTIRHSLPGVPHLSFCFYQSPHQPTTFFRSNAFICTLDLPFITLYPVCVDWSEGIQSAFTHTHLLLTMMIFKFNLMHFNVGGTMNHSAELQLLNFCLDCS